MKEHGLFRLVTGSALLFAAALGLCAATGVDTTQQAPFPEIFVVNSTGDGDDAFPGDAMASAKRQWVTVCARFARPLRKRMLTPAATASASASPRRSHTATLQRGRARSIRPKSCRISATAST